MQSFFNRMHPLHRLIQLNPGWNYAKAGLERNLKNIVQYYQERPFAVKSNHLVARIINTIGVAHDQDTERYYNIVDAKALNLGMAFNLTSSIYRGAIFDGVFYGPGCKEIIFASNEYVNPFEVDKDWKNQSPVTVLCHPRSDMEFLLPTGRDGSVEAGLACININIPMLALQFRAFAREQVQRLDETGLTPFTVANFVHMYVLPGMMKSHMDHVLFNRAYNYTMGAPMGKATKKHRFPVIDYSKQVDEVLRDLIKYVRNNDRPFTDILASFPCMNVKNFEELLKLPEQAPTRQIVWAEVLTRLKALDWMTTVSPTSGTVHDGSRINELTKAFVAHASDGSFRQVLDKDLYLDSIRTIKDIVARIAPHRNFHLE